MRSLRLPALLMLVVAACAEQNTPLPDNSEGDSGSGGGGKTSSGGKTSKGGVANGGVATGGSKAGMSSTGGKVANGGDPGAGGEESTGGEPSAGTGGTGGKASGGTGGKASGGTGGTGGTGGKASGGTGGGGGSGGSGCKASPSSPIAGISARYEPETTSASGTAIGAKLIVANTSQSAVDLSGLKLRYYLTNEVTAPVKNMINWNYYRPNPAGNQTAGSGVVVSLTKLTCTSSSADSYFEFTFPGGNLAAGFQIYFSWSATNDATQSFTQGNDYSFNAAATQSTDDMKLTVHKTDGSLVWGTEP